MNSLFPDLPEQLSPRKAWMKKHDVKLQTMNGSDYSCWCWCGNFTSEDFMTDGAPLKSFFVEADTMDEALTGHAKKRGIPLWNEEQLTFTIMNTTLTEWAARVLNIPISEAPTKALSFRQPWCEFILNPAISKDEENRVWTSKFEGWVFMHASQAKADNYIQSAINWAISTQGAHKYDELGKIRYKDFQTGGIVGAIRIGKSRVVTTKWAMEGHQQIPILEARRLPFVPCKGSQRWFIPQCEPPKTNPDNLYSRDNYVLD